MIGIEWLNDNAGFVMAILTGVYVVATIWILIESHRTNRLQITAIEQTAAFEHARNRPYIVFAIHSELRTHSEHDSEIYFYASAKNLGVTSAHNISIKTVPEPSTRQGWGENNKTIYRTPAMLLKPISVLPPGSELREVVGPTKFVFEDNSDDKLLFEVIVAYSDVIGETYEEKFTIDLASQKERTEQEDIEGKNRHRLLRDVEEGVRALTELVRVLDSPDRSNLFAPTDASTLGSSQIDLLRRLMDACDKELTDATFRVIPLFTGPEICKLSSDKSDKIEGSLANVEYLCRVGALSGYYKKGMLQFTVSPTARIILKSWESDGDAQSADSKEKKGSGF